MDDHSNLNRPPVYEIDGVRYYRSSSVGWCSRALAALAIGYHMATTPQVLADSAIAGKQIEAWYKGRQRAKGIRIVGEQIPITLPVPGCNAVITGHIDGIEYDWDMYGSQKIPYLLEVKSMSDRRYSKWLRYQLRDFPAYQTQLTVYTTKIAMPVKYVVINRDGKNNTDDYKEVDILYLPKQPFSIKPIFAKIRRVEEYVKCNILPNCDPGIEYCRMDIDVCQNIRRKYNYV